MLTLVEKILFVIAVGFSLYYTWNGVKRIINNISSGKGNPDWSLVARKAAGSLVKFLTFQPVFRFRLVPSILHGFIGWGFIAFLLINLSDLIYAYSDWRLLNSIGIIGDLYRFLADIANLAILLGIAAMAFRRFVIRPATLSTRETILLNPQARSGVNRDSAIVAGFIFLHNTGRLLGESFNVALHVGFDPWQPTISMLAK